MTENDTRREPILDKTKKHIKDRRELRMVWKQWKAGLLQEADLSPKMRHLLHRYYGVHFTRKRS